MYIQNTRCQLQPIPSAPAASSPATTIHDTTHCQSCRSAPLRASALQRAMWISWICISPSVGTTTRPPWMIVCCETSLYCNYFSPQTLKTGMSCSGQNVISTSSRDSTRTIDDRQPQAAGADTPAPPPCRLSCFLPFATALPNSKPSCLQLHLRSFQPAQFPTSGLAVDSEAVCLVPCESLPLERVGGWWMRGLCRK